MDTVRALLQVASDDWQEEAARVAEKIAKPPEGSTHQQLVGWVTRLRRLERGIGAAGYALGEGPIRLDP